MGVVSGRRQVDVEIHGRDAGYVLQHFGHKGYPRGKFTVKLLEAMDAADDTNLDNLILGFPSLGEAYYMAKYSAGGIDRLKEIFHKWLYRPVE